VRVIAGRLRGRRLAATRGRGVRPTSDRVREALFSILGGAVVDARVLDLYAGTGALAVEALSRGARAATCVERDPAALAALARNVEELGLEGRLAVTRADAVEACRRLAGERDAFDVVFCDPPYRMALAPLGPALVEAGWWTTVVALEHAAGTEPPAAPAGVTVDERRYGDTALTLYWR
jgi:16S rRNA (guanine(966)-N(2))-methyltransferase RsmD